MESIIKAIYIPLLDEGTQVVRPTQGVALGGDSYRVLGTPNYDLDDEKWEFPPGSIVRGVVETRDGEDIVVARGLVAQE